jgi:heavy metal sensor kinase
MAFLFFYFLIASVIRDRLDQELLNQGRTFSSMMEAKGIEAVQDVAMLEARAGGESKVFFRLLSLVGAVFSSSNMSYWKDIGIDRMAVGEILRGSSHVFDTIVIPGRKHKVRILYRFIGPGVILQLGRSMEHYARFIEAFQKIFVTTMAFLILLAGLIGWFMARRALSGVEAVTRTAQNISVGALEERVPVKKRGDEIDRLATTFNEMLDRIQKLIIMTREMSDNIAHDLKSPLTRIRGIAEVTLTTHTSLEEYKNMAADTIEECDRLLDMINTMLVISQTEAGVGYLKPEAMDMARIVRHAYDLFQPIAEDGQLSMRCHVPDTCNFFGDIAMIQRMVANLLDNAIKNTDPGGRVEISLHEVQGQSVVLSIRDTGIGISEQDLPLIFDRFYRCDPSRSQAGTGLGLSLTRAIVQAHGGHIDVTSNPGQGSTFTVVLPKSRLKT